MPLPPPPVQESETDALFGCLQTVFVYAFGFLTGVLLTLLFLRATSFLK